MVSKPSPFRTKSKDEIKKEVAEATAIAKKIDKVVKDAQACLASDLFTKYKTSLKEAREGLIKLGKIYAEPDPIKYALFCKTIFTKIDAFDMMLEEIQKDSKKGKSNAG